MNNLLDKEWREFAIDILDAYALRKVELKELQLRILELEAELAKLKDVPAT